jgi:single-strand DNA-binding protein
MEGKMVNKWIGIGRLGRDPEVRYLNDGKMITSFSIAVDERYKNNSGEKMSKTEWVNIVAFGKLAEICGNYLAKGKLVYIEGKLQTRSWEDKDGNKRQTTEIICNDMKMLDSKAARQEQAAPAGVPF